jgi:hypothetical protein
MLKSSSIFKRIGANLVEKKVHFGKKKDYSLLRFECFEHAKTFLICVKLLACKLCNYKWKIFQKIYENPQLLCYPCDFLNIQKYSFKKCPFTWVAPLTMFLP